MIDHIYLRQYKNYSRITCKRFRQHLSYIIFIYYFIIQQLIYFKNDFIKIQAAKSLRIVLLLRKDNAVRL